MISDLISECNPEAVIVDGFNEAIIGIASRINLGPVVAYSKTKIIEKLMLDMEVDESELEEDETIEN